MQTVIVTNIQSNSICSYPFSTFSLFNIRRARNNSRPNPLTNDNKRPNDNIIDNILSQYALYGNFIDTITNHEMHVKIPNNA